MKTLTNQRRVKARDTSDIKATLLKYLETWRAMAHQGLAEAHGALRAVLVARFVFTPVIPLPDLPRRKGPGRRPAVSCGVSIVSYKARGLMSS